ncbi:hypothetical protein MAR_016183, partial [Mya arenaria]
MALLTYGEEIAHHCLPSVINLLHSPVEGILSMLTMDNSTLMSCNVWSQAFWCAYSILEEHNVNMMSCDESENFQPAFVALTLIATEDREPVPRIGARHFEHTLGYCMAKIGEAYRPYCDNISNITRDAQSNLGFAMYMEEVLGFSPKNCTFASMEETLCYGKFYELQGFFPLSRQYDYVDRFGDMLDANERCSVVNMLNSHYKEFMIEKADECQAFLEPFLENQLEEMWLDYDKKNWSHCTGEESPCSKYGLVAFMMCYQHIADGKADGCMFEECLATSPLTRQCNITKENLHESLEMVLPKLKVPSPPKCSDQCAFTCTAQYLPVCGFDTRTDKYHNYGNESECNEGMYIRMMEDNCVEWRNRVVQDPNNCRKYEGLLGCINTNIFAETTMKCHFSNISDVAVSLISEDGQISMVVGILPNGDEHFRVKAPHSTFSDFNIALIVMPAIRKRQTDMEPRDLIVITKDYMNQYMAVDMFMDGESAQFDKDFGGYDNFSNLTVESDNSAVTITFTRQKTDHRDVYLHGQHSVELMKVDKASNVTEFLASDNIYLT